MPSDPIASDNSEQGCASIIDPTIHISEETGCSYVIPVSRGDSELVLVFVLYYSPALGRNVMQPSTEQSLDPSIPPTAQLMELPEFSRVRACIVELAARMGFAYQGILYVERIPSNVMRSTTATSH